MRLVPHCIHTCLVSSARNVPQLPELDALQVTSHPHPPDDPLSSEHARDELCARRALPPIHTRTPAPETAGSGISPTSRLHTTSRRTTQMLQWRASYSRRHANPFYSRHCLHLAARNTVRVTVQFLSLVRWKTRTCQFQNPLPCLPVGLFPSFFPLPAWPTICRLNKQPNYIIGTDAGRTCPMAASFRYETPRGERGNGEKTDESQRGHLP